MHGDGFEVDADQLAARAAQFEPLVGRMGTIHKELTDALSADGACWGRDAVGQAFSSVHSGAADDTVARLSALSERLGSVGTRLSDTAETYRAVDQAGTDHLKAAEQ
ncbi:hypothetical protein [Actinophytocola sp.]|uniref:WXG100 family type VII secretion target n=1 Tax=Actinophytocola sp. TaxID=1872138 RepID=UPI002ED51379